MESPRGLSDFHQIDVQLREHLGMLGQGVREGLALQNGLNNILPDLRHFLICSRIDQRAKTLY